MKCGLLPLCQEAVTIGQIVYHDLKSTLDDEAEVASIVETLGETSKVRQFVLCLHGYNATVFKCEILFR
jgi:hypothetical protein